MTDRRGVLLLFYDFPTTTKKQKKQYRTFKKYLLQSGYLTLQESVFVKLMPNMDGCAAEYGRIRSCAVSDSRIMALPLSLAAFGRLEAICGTAFDQAFFSDNLLII